MSNLLDGCGEHRFAPAHDEHLRALRCQALRSCEADAARAGLSLPLLFLSAASSLFPFLLHACFFYTI
jgi:hypothetical protein